MTLKTFGSTIKKPAPYIAAALIVFATGFAVSAIAHPPKGEAEQTEQAGHHEGMSGMKMDHKGMAGMKMGGHDHGGAAFSFGHPSPDATPDRVITINAMDSMRYDPSEITVKAGSVVKFVVTNKGEIAHAWAIDTVAEQKEHEEGMANVEMDNMMSHMDNEPNGFVLKPGETKSLIWTFTKGGDIQYACHLPGHYDAGMHGAVNVSGGPAAPEKAHAHGEAHEH